MKPFSFKLLLTICCFFAACSAKSVFNGVDITGADYANDFVFIDQDGTKFTLESFHGKVVALFFGYTQCPDVCPTTLAEFTALKKELGADADRFQVLFVSVDPKRDKTEVLKAYMSNFDPSFKGYSPTDQDLEQITKRFKIYYKKVPGSSKDSNIYTVDHSAGTYLFDPQGKIRLFMRYGMNKTEFLADVKALLRSS
jgi:protein SCO1/2